MINRKNILITCIALLPFGAMAQVAELTPEVIASSGGHSTIPSGGLAGATVSFTVGELITTTKYASGTPFIVTHLTQGFHQPTNSANTLSLNEVATNSSCIGGNNGTIFLLAVTSTGAVTYTWGPPLSTTGNLQQNLAPGVYYYNVTDGTFSINDSVIITEDQIECTNLLVFWNGITPNGDLNNDSWIIDGINNIAENNVAIFNRWGDKVWEANNYDNMDRVWKGDNQGGQPLPDATYFYLVTAGGKVYKGWVELTH